MDTELRHVILIEDNEDDAELARIALKRTNVPHVLTVFASGEAAVDYLYAPAVRATPPDLVLLDLKLPKVDGKTILREVRGNPLTARVPVVALTSSRLEQDLVDAYCLGANSYFVKPVEFEDFIRSTTVMMTYWLGLNLSPPHFQKLGPEIGLSIAAAADALRMPAKPRLTSDLVVVDANREDCRRTVDAVASYAANRVRELRGFDEVINFLKGVGGPPPLLSPAFPRLFVVDVELDQGDGRDVLQALRYRCDHHALVVMFTGNTDPAFVSECYRVKVSGVVRKPDDPREYRDAVRLLAYYWMYVNEPPPDPCWSKQAIAHPG